MDDLFVDRCPEGCASLGLDCHRCVSTSAGKVAAVCRGMNEEGAAKIFVQLYPSVGCAPMMAAFQAAYAEASVPRKPMLHAVVAA